MFSMKGVDNSKKYNTGELPKTEKDWIAYTKRLHDAGLNARKKYEFQWTLNLAYVLGYQSLAFSYNSGKIVIPKSLETPLTINRIASFVESRHAKLTKNRPVPRTIPNTNDQEDINGAKNSDLALMHLWRQSDMEEEYDDWVTLMLITGTSFMRNVWEPYEGDFVVRAKKGENDELVVDSEGEIDQEKIFMGEVSSKALSSFNIIPGNELCRHTRYQPWMIERSWMSISDVYHNWPHLKGLINATSELGFGGKTEYESLVDRMSSAASSAIGSAIYKMNDNTNDQVLIISLWIRPSDQYPNGVLCIVIGDQIAYLDKFPNQYGKNVYPFVKLSERSNGLHFWAQSTVERLMPIQKAFNRLRQKKYKNILLMANGKWMSPKGAQVSEDSFTDEEAEVIEYNSAVPEPHQAVLAPLPNYAMEFSRELIVDFRDVGGQRETSVTPMQNLTAGVAMQIAAELSDEIITPIIRRLARATKVIANQQLLLMNDEYTDDRKVSVLGDDNTFGVQMMSNVDFKHHTDIHIEIESMFPDYRGAKKQALIDLWDRRIVTDPKTFLNAYRFGNYDKLLDDIEKEEDPVWIDIEAIKKGKEPEIQPFQNHLTYFKVLSKWIQTPEFLRLIPERKELAIAVLQGHMQFLMESMPAGGAPVKQQNQAAVGTEFGSQRPVGA